MRRGSPNYSEELARHGLVSTLQGPWASVGQTTRVQGWKIHLSSIPIEATALLSAVAPFFSRHGTAFKAARDETVLSRLNEGDMGPTQVGKFLTVYPASDEEAKLLADNLIDITREFHGPVIPSDMRIGAITYARYGGFSPVITRNRFAQVSLSIYAPDGTLRADSRPVPFTLPEGVPNLFSGYLFRDRPPAIRDSAEAGFPQSEPAAGKLFGPGYLIVEVVSFRPKGSIFRAIDLRSQAQVGIKVIKQGRQHCLSDEFGRDIRTRLKHQEALHNELAWTVPIARADPYFEVDGDGYLPLEDIAGETIESFAARSLGNRAWFSLSPDEQSISLSCLEQLVTAVQHLHGAGYVHRDLSASNIWIGADGRVYLLDLELAHRIDDLGRVFGRGTPGFMSPAQEDGECGSFADDVYALGCIMTLVVTGFDPRRVLFAGEKDRVLQLSALTGGAPVNFVEVIAQCLKREAVARPSLDAIKATILECLTPSAGNSQRIASGASYFRDAAPGATDRYTRLIRGGQEGLLRDVIADEDSGLWLSAESTTEIDGRGASSFQLHRDANRGVAGVVYLLGRLARFGFGTETARLRAQQAAEWLLTTQDEAGTRQPGLHFGEAGVVVALAEAIAGGLIERDARVDVFLSKGLSGVLDWPDITHGAAGQGVAAIYCADRLGDPKLLDLSHRCAAFLVGSQAPDGSWKMPAGVEGMSGETLTGFAHGVGGIVYFLAEYARRTGDGRAHSSCEAGTRWLAEQAISANDGEALEWKYSDVNSDRWGWWCHGSPGVSLTFLKLFELTGNSTYREFARKALRAHPPEIRYQNLSQCHGISGLGDIYLEASRVLDEREWLDRAENIASLLFDLRRETEAGSITWLVENPHLPTADLMVGSSGVIHFLLRLLLGAKQAGFPLLLDPAY
jgi:serine/threonine protein kinase